MLTGPCRGEISALRWRHVDLDRGLLTITRGNAQPKTGLKEKHTKTGQARKIALDKHTVDLLAKHRRLWIERCDELGVPLSPDASSSPPRRTAPSPTTYRGPSASTTAGSRCDSSSAAPACTHSGTTPRQN